MGKVGKVIAGIGLIVTGAVIGIFTQNWSLAFAVASMGVGILTMPKMPGEGDLKDRAGAILENRVGSLHHLPVVYGMAKIAGVFVDIRVHDASTERKRLVLVSAFCHGSRDGTGVTGIDEVWFDDRKAVIGSVVQPPFDVVVAGESPAIKYLQYEHHLGDSTQNVDSRLVQLFPVQWSGSARGRGVCYTRYELWYNGDIYPGGIPTIQIEVRGNKVYDPRDATWKHSTNPALCIRDYILSSIYGMGIAEANLEEQSFIDMANYCDELVNIPGGGTQKRYELSGWVDTGRAVEQNLAELCSACRGQVVNEGDKWRMIIRRARTVSSFKITEKNTVEGAWQFILPGANLCPNVARATYIDPSRNFTVDTVQWPEPGQPNQYLTDDNSYEQRLEMDLPFTDNRIRCQQIAMTLLKESREAIGVICTLKEEALQTRVGELVSVTYSTPGWVDKVFDVAALMLQPDGLIRAVLIEYEPTVYDLDVQFAQPAAMDTNLPNPFATPAPTSLTLVSAGQELTASDGGSIPRIRVTWLKANDPFVDYYEIQAKKTAETNFDSHGRHPALDPAEFFVYPVTTDESWSVRIRAVNKLGVQSTWLEETHIPVVQDPRPQILSITLTNAHADSGHVDIHTDIGHGDAGHTDGHTDSAHTDHNDHGDTHGDSGTHDDVAHQDNHSDVGNIDTDHTDTHSDAPHTDHSDGHGDTHTDTDHMDVGHGDTHGDVGSVDTDHTDTHIDNAHADHSDSGLGHIDVAHVDLHSDVGHADSAHSDGHTDVSHTDGQHGIGVAIQADTDSASIKAVARKISGNKVLNGGGEFGTVGAQATSWTAGAGSGLLVASDFYKSGSKSLKVDNPSALDSYNYQDVAVIVGKRYRLEGWIKTSALPLGDAGFGAMLNVDPVSGVTGFTIVEKLTIGTDVSPTNPDCGIAADGIARDFTYVFCRFIPTGANGTVRLYCQLGYGGAQSGTAWFDEIGIFEDEPSALDVRSQQAVDGRNVVIELIDMATGAMISLVPGDMVRVGALAYAEANAGGVEGPLALASVGMFTVAPVGTDLWVPS